uniref:Uncharacterized protein n=2 Tax=Oryza TaxID=4527 RepID=A0A0D3G5Z0_9ORYZ
MRVHDELDGGDSAHRLLFNLYLTYWPLLLHCHLLLFTRPITKTRAASSTDVVAKLDLDTEGWESGEEVDLELTGTLRRRRLVKARGRQCMEETLGEAEFELANTDFMAKRCSLLEVGPGDRCGRWWRSLPLKASKKRGRGDQWMREKIGREMSLNM